MTTGKINNIPIKLITNYTLLCLVFNIIQYILGIAKF